MEQVTQDLAEGLNNLGHQCDVLVANSHAASSAEVVGGVNVYRAATYGVFMSTPLSIAYARNLMRAVRTYDVVQVHLPNPLASAALALVSQIKSAIVVLWHADAISYPAAYTLIAPLDARLLTRARAIMVTSHHYAATSTPLRPFATKTHVVPIGISAKGAESAPGMVASIKERYRNKKLVFSLGRLVPYKGFDTLIRAARSLPDHVALAIGGDGPQRLVLRELINTERVAGKVTLLGRLSDADVAAYMDASDIFCLPSINRAEAFGVVLLEAMRAGKPIVATNIPGSGVSWVNDHGTTGLNVEPGNATALARAIVEVLGDSGRYRKFCKAAHARFLDHFTRERMVSSTLDIFQKVA
jgi:glycosyltransferase involved in cell wall biosynthesis